jgi:hypothetical protein
MALDLSLSLCSTNGCSDLRVYETTGLYNAQDATGGYGTVNPEASACSVTRFKITMPDGTIFDTNAGDTFANIWLTPSDNVDSYFVIPGSEIGYSIDSVPDGIYELYYEIIDNTVPPVTGTASYSCTNVFLITCTVECCLKTKLLTIKTSDCGCYDQDIDKMLIAQNVLKAAKYEAECGHRTEALNMLTFVQDYCASVDCRECN